MITINPFVIPPVLGMQTVHVLANEVGYMTMNEPARLMAQMEVCTSAAAVRNDEAALMHFMPTGHFCRTPIENGYTQSAYKAFVMSAIHKKLPVDSDESKRSYLRFMTRCLDSKKWRITLVYPYDLKHDPAILTPFDIYNHLERFATSMMVRRDVEVEVVPKVRTSMEIFLK